MARPPKEINWEVVLKRMQAGNNAKTIANLHEIDLDTLYRRFKDEFGCSFGDYKDQATECGKSNIAYTQYMKALSGNVQMLIHLGREWLGQGKEENSTIPPQQTQIDKDHLIMQQQHTIEELMKKIGNNGNESQAE